MIQSLLNPSLEKSTNPRSPLNKTNSYTILPTACMEKHSPCHKHCLLCFLLLLLLLLFFLSSFFGPLRRKQIHPLMGNEINIAVLIGTESVNHQVASQACRNGKSLKFPCSTGLGYSSLRSAKEINGINNPLI